MAMKATVSFKVSEDDIREVAREQGLEIENMPPAYFEEVVEEILKYIMSERVMAISHALTQTDNPETYPDIDHRRATAFCEWIERRIFRLNSYIESRGGYCRANIVGMKDNIVAIEIQHGDNPLDEVKAIGHVNADKINDPQENFDTMYKQMFFSQ